MTTYTQDNRRYQVHDCKTCEGSGLAPWHLGCGDSGPPECHKCDGIGQYATEITPTKEATNG
jgi:DnaJ-class molecular chaperone